MSNVFDTFALGTSTLISDPLIIETFPSLLSWPTEIGCAKALGRTRSQQRNGGLTACETMPRFNSYTAGTLSAPMQEVAKFTPRDA